MKILPDQLMKHRHHTYKRLDNDVIHYVVVIDNCVTASIELNKSPCGNYWVRHSVSKISHQGYGFALYQLVMQDIYPQGIMPSRECTSGHAIGLWDKLYKQPSITKTPVIHSTVYCSEFDEWLDEIAEVNPALGEVGVANLEKDCSYLSAVQKQLMNPHPYNNTYHLKPLAHFEIIEKSCVKYFQDATDLFNSRYDFLDF